MTFDILGDRDIDWKPAAVVATWRLPSLAASRTYCYLGWHTGFFCRWRADFSLRRDTVESRARDRAWLFPQRFSFDFGAGFGSGCGHLINHTDTLIRACVDGTGISSQSIDLVANHLHSGELQRVLSPWITGTNTLYAALPSRKFIPKRASVFLKFMTGYTRTVIKKMEERSK